MIPSDHYLERCVWCKTLNVPTQESCQCSKPCGAGHCPMLEGDEWFESPPVPIFRKAA